MSVKNELLEMLKSGIIEIDETEARAIVANMKEKYVQEHHKGAIYFVEAKNLWRTYINVDGKRKEKNKKERKDLIDYLYQFYKEQETAQTSTLKEVFERNEDYRLNVKNLSTDTIERDWVVWRRFFTTDFYNRNIADITDDEISEYFNRRTKELYLKERAVKDTYQLLGRIFKYAIQNEKIIKDNPVARVDYTLYYSNGDTTVKPDDEKIFTPQEISEIKHHIREKMNGYEPFLYAMLFSIETGVRVGELPTLRWSDITPKGIHIHTQQRMKRIKGVGRFFEELPYTKNEKKHPKGGRYFPLTDEIKSILAELKVIQESCGIKSEFIFCNRDGSWLNKESYSQRLRRLCKKLGFTVTNNHAFRMSLNSNVFIPAGIPVTQRAYLLGHSVAVNEQHYSRFHTDSLPDICDTLNGFSHSRSCNVIDFPKQKENPETLAI